MSLIALRIRSFPFGSGAHRVRALGATLGAVVFATPPALTNCTRDPTVTDSLRFTLVAPATVRAGRPVTFTLRFTNVTQHPVEAHFLGREIAFDIVVALEDERIVWRRLARSVVPGILQVRTLQPGASLEWTATWQQEDNEGKAVSPGIYTVWGLLPSDDPEPRRTTSVKLRITR